MANGKAMTVGEMASLFLDPATPVRIDAFDGSHFGPADADLKVNVATPNCMYQLLAHPNEIGIVRAYILGDFDVEGIDYADPYPAMRKLISLSKYVTAHSCFHRPRIRRNTQPWLQEAAGAFHRGTEQVRPH